MEVHNLIKVLMGMIATKGPVAIHGGNFMLFDPPGHTPLPWVGEELRLLGKPELADVAEQTHGIHAATTFRWAAELAATLRAEDRKADLCTLVNDWQYLRSADQNAVRAAFYRAVRQSKLWTLEAFRRELDARGLTASALIKMPRKHALISEQYLRGSFTARVRKMAKEEADLFDFDGLSCQLLGAPLLDSHGRAGCSGEVVELAIQLYNRGYRTLVLFYPEVCRGFVRTSADLASEFGVGGMKIITIAVPASGERTEDELLQRIRIEE